MKYSKARAEVILFDNTDIVTASCQSFSNIWDLSMSCVTGNNGKVQCSNFNGSDV